LSSWSFSWLNWLTRLTRVELAATVAVPPLPSTLPVDALMPVTVSAAVDRLVICSCPALFDAFTLPAERAAAGDSRNELINRVGSTRRKHPFDDAVPLAIPMAVATAPLLVVTAKLTPSVRLMFTPLAVPVAVKPCAVNAVCKFRQLTGC